MRVEQKSAYKNSIVRLVVMLALIAFQIWFIISMITRFASKFPWLQTLMTWAAIVCAFAIYNRRWNAAFKIPWIMFVIAFPIVGLCCYFLMGSEASKARMHRKFEHLEDKTKDIMSQDPAVLDELDTLDQGVANEFRYVLNESGMPVYSDTDVRYYADSAEALAAQIEDLRHAEQFIFMEYHAIEDAESFAPVHEILKQKAKEGLEVRLFYDDIGSIGFLNGHFIRKMEKDGIQCRDFNPVVPALNVFMNNRDHRKITVIDGKIGYTGGYNLANEYFHITEPYGYWKDTGIRLEGGAVGSLTLMFLELWNAIKKTDVGVKQYMPANTYEPKEHGFVQPYGQNPLRREHLAEEVYLNVLRNAKKYCWFVTPYLIITDDMIREMTGAAKRGVDVRIITPGIPDKKMVYKETRSYYNPLCRSGVRIFEYTPGFCHAKMCICDDKVATVGTINLDYRSLYHHFENGVLMYDTCVIPEIKDDFEAMFKAGREVTRFYAPDKLEWGKTFLRLISPLL